MKRLIYKSLAFTFFAVFIYCVLLIALGKVLPVRWKTNLFYTLPSVRFTYTRLREIDTTKNADILILGTSHAYEGYDPRIFKQHNWHAVNLGTTAQSFIQTELLVKRYIGQLKPKYVIFDINPALFLNDGVESGLDLVSNSGLRTDVYEMAWKLNNIKVYNTLIYSTFMKVFVLNKEFKEPQINEEGKYVKGGYVENYLKYKPGEVFDRSAYEIRADQFTAFKNVIAILKEKKIPYALVQAPMVPMLYQSATNNEPIDRLMAQYGSYYNFNKISSIPLNCFKNKSHLNQYGVNIFNGDVIKVLEKSIKKACER